MLLGKQQQRVRNNVLGWMLRGSSHLQLGNVALLPYHCTKPACKPQNNATRVFHPPLSTLQQHPGHTWCTADAQSVDTFVGAGRCGRCGRCWAPQRAQLLHRRLLQREHHPAPVAWGCVILNTGSCLSTANTQKGSRATRSECFVVVSSLQVALANY